MGTKTISIKNEAYEALLREKIDKESLPTLSCASQKSQVKSQIALEHGR